MKPIVSIQSIVKIGYFPMCNKVDGSLVLKNERD